MRERRDRFREGLFAAAEILVLLAVLPLAVGMLVVGRAALLVALPVLLATAVVAWAASPTFRRWWTPDWSLS